LGWLLILGQVRELKLAVDIVVVVMHWGLEYKFTVDREREQLAKFLASLGVNAVIGHHPHVLQPHAVIGNTTVIYSCGNYVFDSHFCRDHITGEFNLDGVLDSPSCLKFQARRRKVTTLAARRSRHYQLHVNVKGVVRAEYMPVLIDERSIPTPVIADGDAVAKWQAVCGPDDLHCIECT
jgi:hypothetical protein